MTRTWLVTLVALLLLAAGSLGLYWFLQPPPLPPGLLYGNGQLEAKEVTVSAEVTGRLVETPMEEGSRIEEGALLARIDDAESRARLAETRAQRRALGKEREGLAARLDVWRHHLETARAALERARRLHARDAVPQAEVDRATDRVTEARGQVQGLEAQLAENKARAQALAARLERLTVQLEKTEIRAPRSATLLVQSAEAGEVVTPGRAIGVLADLSTMELTVYLPVDRTGKIALGDPARVKVDAFPDRRFPARVIRVDQQARFTPRAIHMPDERTRLVYGLTLAVPNPDGVLKPGMPADAWIRWRDRTEWPADLVVPR